MKRRLDIAAALVLEPEIIFLDEPTTGLDPASRLVVWELISKLNTEDGVTVFLTTQYLEEADRLCKEIAIIDHGSIVAHGSPAQLKAEVGADVISIELADSISPGISAAVVHDVLGLLRGAEGIKISDDKAVTLFAKAGATLSRILCALWMRQECEQEQ